MRRRLLLSGGLAVLWLLLAQRQAHAAGLEGVSNAEASKGLQAALETGALSALGLLGKPDGFMGNPRVRIPLPGFLESAAKLLKTLGKGQQVDELVTAMNRAAESAVPQARALLLGAVKSMSFGDAKKILLGGETSVTAFFVERHAPRWA
jgi:hypothetical protein